MASNPTTKVSKRNEIFNNDQEESTLLNDDETSKRMEAMMNMVLVETDQDETTVVEEQASMDEDEEEEFAFRLFSTDTVAKVSIKENDDEVANALSQQIANQQQIDHDETDPTFITQVAQASISYDDIMQQSLWSYPALQLPKRVLHLPSTDTTTTTTTIPKPKRKSKKRRDYEKAVKEGRITPKPNMRDPATLGGWPGYPGGRDPCAIITAQPYRGNRGNRGKPMGGRGGFNTRGGRGGGPSRFKKQVTAM
ncbi:hypothetical protein BC941DRAFT_407751 [Chlamydoabsidia padenii]|nr:hypothetical protein BC941DRAFT_407751 [Chlamydoabsidia padenii]